MKTLDALAAVLLVVGGLNWGLVGAFQFDLVATVLGPGTAASAVIYIVVGLSALYGLYHIIQCNSIRRRWSTTVN